MKGLNINEERLSRGISIIVCCYNSAGRIGPTLEHLAKQTFLSTIAWELVLVDNACTDATGATAQNCWMALGAPAPLRFLREPKQGTDQARRAGLMAARHDYFVFCDDDNWLAPEYLQTAVAYLDKHPDVGLVGCQSKALSDDPLPDWFSEVTGYYAVGQPGATEKDITHFGHWGAGLAGRTKLMQQTMPAEIPLLLAGRVAGNTGFGEDGEMCMRVAMQGYRLVYLPGLSIHHYMSPNRLTLSYRDQLLAGAALPAMIMATYFRWLYLHEQKGLRKTGLVLKQVGAWIAWTILNKKTLKGRSKDFLFYATGITLFQNNINKVVQQYGHWLHQNGLNRTF